MKAADEVSRDDISELPLEKIQELFEKTVGGIQYCSECGEQTAFIGRTGTSDSSDCHNCGHTIGF